MDLSDWNRRKAEHNRRERVWAAEIAYLHGHFGVKMAKLKCDTRMNDVELHPGWKTLFSLPTGVSYPWDASSRKRVKYVMWTSVPSHFVTPALMDHEAKWRVRRRVFVVALLLCAVYYFVIA